MQLPNLYTLYLGWNRLERLPTALRQLTNLAVLDLSGNFKLGKYAYEWEGEKLQKLLQEVETANLTISSEDGVSYWFERHKGAINEPKDLVWSGGFTQEDVETRRVRLAIKLEACGLPYERTPEVKEKLRMNKPLYEEWNRSGLSAGAAFDEKKREVLQQMERWWNQEFSLLPTKLLVAAYLRYDAERDCFHFPEITEILGDEDFSVNFADPLDQGTAYVYWPISKELQSWIEENGAKIIQQTAIYPPGWRIYRTKELGLFLISTRFNTRFKMNIYLLHKEYWLNKYQQPHK
jgi:hypothetical protein